MTNRALGRQRFRRVALDKVEGFVKAQITCACASTACLAREVEDQSSGRFTLAGGPGLIEGAPRLASETWDGSWSDYIYANGQRIHIEGTSTVAESYAGWYLPLATYVIKSGDKISWRKYQAGAKGGIGIGFTDGTTPTGSPRTPTARSSMTTARTTHGTTGRAGRPFKPSLGLSGEQTYIFWVLQPSRCVKFRRMPYCDPRYISLRHSKRRHARSV